MIIDSIFGDGATIGLTAAITNFVSQLALLPEMLLTYLMTGLSIIWNWGVQIVTAGFTIASQFLTSIFTFVSQLPTQLWKLFLSGLNYILIFGVNAAARAATAGQGILNGVMGFVKTIPEKVYQEFVRIGEKILSVGGDLYNKAKNVAQNIWDGMNSIFQMSSPGMMFHMISAEVDRIVGVFSSNTLNAFRSAQDLGKGIFSGFNHGIDINNLGNVMINGSIEPYDYSSDYRIEYPSNDKYVLEINSVIAEASVVDTFEYYVDKVKERNRMRS
jgi:hypothetical protein